jgi:SNF2 family DNA or RNA helicase
MRVATELEYTTQPYSHQEEALTLAWGNPAFAFFLEQGTGKSKIVIDETVNLIKRGLINCVVILAPNQVHENWKEQFELHGPPNFDRWTIQVYKAQSTPKARDRQEQLTRNIIKSGKVLVFLMNIESLSHKYASDYLYRVLRARNATYMCIDESHKIKSNSAIRTKTAITLGQYAKYRRIATGTEAEEGIHNLFTQMKFLDWHIIGFKFYTPFKNMYCIMGGYENRQIVGFQNQPLLAAKIAPYIYQKRKKDCLDLPEKLYVTHHIDMTPEQETLYNRLEDELLIEFEDGKLLDVTMVLSRLVKLQEILCGHLHVEGTVKTIPSNRAMLVSELVDGAKKSIVFCRFVMDVSLVVKQLENDDIGAIGITGETNNRLDFINSWRKSDKLKALVMTGSTGGTGLTLNESNNMIFYSNSWSATDRLQSEDRIHRIGQTEKCTYHDITVKGKVDHMILKALRSKSNLADKFRKMMDEGKAKNIVDFIRED